MSVAQPLPIGVVSFFKMETSAPFASSRLFCALADGPNLSTWFQIKPLWLVDLKNLSKQTV